MGLLLISLLVVGCSQKMPESTSTTVPTGVLTAYRTPTATASRPTPTINVTIPVTPSPTPTPFLHTITNDDTMLGLAFRYGVKLEDLKTANPKVNPNAMSVGSQLVIPVNTQAPENVSTPTVIPLRVQLPICYRSGDGGAWCVSSVRNDLKVSIENISIWIGLYDSGGENFASQVADAPLNILRPGSTMPLMAYYPPPLPDQFTAHNELLSAYPLSAEDDRYLDATVKTAQVTIQPDESLAEVSGEVVLPPGTATPSQVWVLVMAYDAQENILGVRKWKSAGETTFDTQVYSLGGVIDHVQFLVEARP